MGEGHTRSTTCTGGRIHRQAEPDMRSVDPIDLAGESRASILRTDRHAIDQERLAIEEQTTVELGSLDRDRFPGPCDRARTGRAPSGRGRPPRGSPSCAGVTRSPFASKCVLTLDVAKLVDDDVSSRRRSSGNRPRSRRSEAARNRGRRCASTLRRARKPPAASESELSATQADIEVHAEGRHPCRIHAIGLPAASP